MLLWKTAEMWFAPSMALVQEIVNPFHRSLATSIYMMTIGLAGVSPVLVGIITEGLSIKVSNNTDNPAIAIIVVVMSSMISSIVFYAIAVISIKHEEMERRKAFLISNQEEEIAL